MIEMPHILNGTPEWYEARKGMVTASNFKKALTLSPDKKSIGETAKTYAFTVAAQRMGDEEDEVETRAMIRGSLLEPEALEEYSDFMMRNIIPQSIVFHDDLNVSGTPDGFINDRSGQGIVECKCRTAAKHAQYLINRTITPDDMWQVQGNLWLTRRDFCDFISYRPGVPEKQRLVIIRIDRDEKIITDIGLRIGQFVDLVDGYTAALGIDDWVPYHRRSLAA